MRFLSIFRKKEVTPAQAAAVLSKHRVANERALIIAKANEMRRKMGMPAI